MGHQLQETEIFENFEGHHCPLSGHVIGSLETNKGQKCTFLCARENPVGTVKGHNYSPLSIWPPKTEKIKANFQ